MQKTMTNMFNSKLAAPKKPTNSEYQEARDTDIDPDTHDRATYKRLRDMGVPHDTIIDSNIAKIPLEDFESAVKNNPEDHEAAKKEALGYRSQYTNILNMNRAFQESHPEWDKPTPLGYDEHASIVKKLFKHQLSLRNGAEDNQAYDKEAYKPTFEDENHPLANPMGMQRARSWILNECCKLEPRLKAKLNNKSHAKPEDILLTEKEPSSGTYYRTGPQLGYYNHVNTLINHYRRNMTVMRSNDDPEEHAENIKNYIINRRKLDAVLNIGSSMYYPQDYKHDVYEEEE